MKEIFKKSIPFLLILSNLNTLHVYGKPIEKDDNQPLVTLYEQETLEESYLAIPKESKVILKKIINDELLLIEYYPEKEEEEFEKDPLYIDYISIEDVSHIKNIEELEVEDELFLYPELDEEKKKIEDIEETENEFEEESEIEDSKTESSKKEDLELEEKIEDNLTDTAEDQEEERISLYSVSKEISYRGRANKKVHVYSETDKDSSVLKSYSEGSILQYRGNDTSIWYAAKVKVDGQWKAGYISHQDVENITENQVSLRGISVKNQTHVYSRPTTSSSIRKSYSQGRLLKYKTFTKDWYQATVIVNGKKQTGYIHKSHVEEPVAEQKSLRGIGIKSPTRVYKDASTTSSVWKSYKPGKILRFKTYTNDWYEATVIIKGKKETGYIHRSHVEIPTENPESLHGIGIKSPTRVYKDASTSSGVWKSYKSGKTLRFRTFTKNWYQATVLMNGKKETGYIHHSDIEQRVELQESLRGVAQKDKTPIYKEPRTSSKIIKNYSRGNILQYKSLTDNWYEAKVKVGKDYVSGFIHKSDVAAELVTYTDYRISFNQALDIQSARSNQHTRETYKTYLDPNKHDKIQHLRLDKTIGVSATELNKVLAGKGTLNKQGQSFINSAKIYNLNEAYLIAHAIHETGNGQSDLAQGIQVGKNKNGEPTMVTKNNKKDLTNIKTTYNMYGIGAVDRNPNKFGSEKAYELGWFSPSLAIQGGANWIHSDYIQNEHNQNTLYKMRWNPNMDAGHAWKQYATDPGWAVKQTKFIQNIYKQLSNPVYHYDIPIYK